MYVENYRAHRTRKDPISQHGIGEGEWHAEYGHDQISRCQIDEESTEVRPRSASNREDNDGQNVAKHREKGGERVDDDEKDLSLQGVPEESESACISRVEEEQLGGFGRHVSFSSIED